MITEPLNLPNPDKLSVIMICKNEATNVDKIIPQVERFADEIIVNDTGSTDRTVELLSKYKSVRIIQGKWVDSFSVARNQAKSHATYGWVLWLDFDDRVPESEAVKINKLKKGPLDRWYNFRVISTEEGGLPIGVEINQSRMFPNHPEIAWRYRVHESFIEAMEPFELVKVYTDVEIHHTGYEDKSLKKSKQRRNIALMELDEEQHGDSARFQIGKGDAYGVIGKHTEAIEIYKSVYTEETKKAYPGQYNAIRCRIGNCFLHLEEWGNAVLWYDRSADNVEAIYNTGRCKEHLKDYEGAIKSYFATIDFPYRISHEGSHFHRCKMYAFQCLVMILVGHKREHEAVRVITKMLKMYPHIKLHDPNHAT